MKTIISISATASNKGRALVKPGGRGPTYSKREVTPVENKEKIKVLKQKIKDLTIAHNIRVKALETKMKALGWKKSVKGDLPARTRHTPILR